MYYHNLETYDLIVSALKSDDPQSEIKSILVDSASYDEVAKLGQMCWDCGNGQKYYFGIWDR